jgi:glycosyltransferase involved in cell wall biosynthesis
LIQYGIETPEDPQFGEAKGSGFGGNLADELKKELGIGPGTYIWISVGRLTRQKGLVYLLEAFSRLHQNNGDSVLLIVGDGEDREMLNKRARDLGINDRVIFAGARQDTFALMGISDAFVLSSLWEGGPLVILEAMAAGLPVVSTKVGDAPFMVQQGRTGTLVDPGDVRQLADAMALIEDMGPEAAVWGRNGQRKVEEHYNFRRVQKEMELFYQELACKAPVR